MEWRTPSEYTRVEAKWGEARSEREAALVGNDQPRWRRTLGHAAANCPTSPTSCWTAWNEEVSLSLSYHSTGWLLLLNCLSKLQCHLFPYGGVSTYVQEANQRLCRYDAIWMWLRAQSPHAVANHICPPPISISFLSLLMRNA